MEFEWVYCELCQVVTGTCPKCGSNCCNGTYGQDGECDVCPKVYDAIDEAIKNGKRPSKDGLRVLPDSFKELLEKYS